jgi:glycosyltransferase involved in cell wall biosynthesis
MKVAIDARLVAGTNTGDSTYWTCLIDALARGYPELELMLYSNSTAGKVVPVHPNIRWIHLPARSSRWWSLVRFPLAARKIAQLTHAQYSLSPLVRNGVTTIHDVSFFIGPEWFSRKDRLILQSSIPATVRRAKRVLTVSDTSAKEIIHWIPEALGKVVVSKNACPPWIQQTQPIVEHPYLLTVGTRWARKNMDLVVQAMDLLGDELPHKLKITGKSVDSAGLGARCVATGYVSNEQLCDLYSGAALYLAPSFHEGFGIPILEAFRCGTPVICGPGGAMPEVAGDAATVAPDYKIETWCELIKSVLRNPSKMESMRNAGREREKKFTWQDSAAQTMAAYQEALNA